MVKIYGLRDAPAMDLDKGNPPSSLHNNRLAFNIRALEQKPRALEQKPRAHEQKPRALD